MVEQGMELRQRLRQGDGVAALLWCLTVLVATIGGVAGHRTVTDVYHGAVDSWLARQDLYGGGYQYPPQFVLVFAPFHALPYAVGECLWRLLSLHLPSPERRRHLLPWISLPILLTGFDAFRNGQANVIFGALTVLGACVLAGDQRPSPRRLNQAALLLTLAFLIKPLGIVIMLLALLAWPALIWRFAALTLLAAALPYLTAPADYVDRQYQQMAVHLAAMSHNPEARFADFNDLLRMLHLSLGASWWLAARAGAGLAFAWLWLRSRAGSSTDSGSGASPALALYGLAAIYLMLFNPMTEQNSYIIVAPFMALLACGAAGRVFSGAVRAGLMALMLSMTILPELLRHPFPDLGLWWHPLTITVFGLVFGAGVLFPAASRRQPVDAEIAQPAAQPGVRPGVIA